MLERRFLKLDSVKFDIVRIVAKLSGCNLDEALYGLHLVSLENVKFKLRDTGKLIHRYEVTLGFLVALFGEILKANRLYLS